MQRRVWGPQGQTEQTKDFPLKYKRYATPCMSPTGTNRTKEKDFTLKYKRYA